MQYSYHLPSIWISPQNVNPNASLNAYSLRENEIILTKKALRKAHCKKSKLAKLSGIDVCALYKEIERYEISDKALQIANVWWHFAMNIAFFIDVILIFEPPILLNCWNQLIIFGKDWAMGDYWENFAQPMGPEYPAIASVDSQESRLSRGPYAWQSTLS